MLKLIRMFNTPCHKLQSASFSQGMCAASVLSKEQLFSLRRFPLALFHSVCLRRVQC